MLVDTFPHQAIDFFGAVRAQIYNEQIRDFIYQVGLENVSRNVVNTLTPPTFAKPDFSLSHLLDVGHRLVREQRRVEEMKLANEYNRVLQQPQSHATVTDGFYRAYPVGGEVTHPNSSASEHPSPLAGPSQATISKFSIPEDTRQHIRTLLAQGYRIGVEHVDARRFQTNAWKSGPKLSEQNSESALETLEQYLEQYAGEYVRLIGFDPKTRQRILEQIIQRP